MTVFSFQALRLASLCLNQTGYCTELFFYINMWVNRKLDRFDTGPRGNSNETKHSSHIVAGVWPRNTLTDHYL